MALQGISKKLVTALDAVTATTTSNAINIANAKKVTLQLTRANHGSGSSAFSVTASLDGTNFYDINCLIQDLTNSNSQDYTRVSSITLSSDTTEFAAIDLANMGFDQIKVTVTETTDGTHSAKVLVEYN